MKKLSLMFLIIGCLAIVSASWYFIIVGDLNVVVDSIGGTNELSLVFPMFLLNTTEDSDSQESLIEFIYNKEGSFQVGIIETFADTSGGLCLDGENDCSTEVFINYGNETGDTGTFGHKINNLDNISIPYNLNAKNLTISMSCVAYACPQERTVRVSLTEL